ncbi:DsrE family protein [Arthrobacter sp. H14-L1]|uniref:DsrE family protein n=1 Tax=Arthrobacter sp. H14-L1 TaxID=2996697 RepID=UPI00226F23EF|nr:DsrE family protein [Arthrobacter sp. H14-L1]MCY0906028.1 DsrE family protein [Arthrobacter sp. H14-L1]
MNKAAISLTTGLEDPERVTVAFLVAVGAAEQGRETLMFLTKEAVRLVLQGFAHAVACDGCPPLTALLERYEKAGGKYLVCPICLDSRRVDRSGLMANAVAGGTVQLWNWIGEDPVVTFSY